jgi:hypothetical protein
LCLGKFMKAINKYNYENSRGSDENRFT